MKNFTVTNIPSYKYEALEPLGTKRKFWFTNDSDNFKYLFKIGRDNTGENWVEVVVAEICELLNIPHANYQFATWQNKEGTISKNFVPSSCRLVHGNELLAKVHKELPLGEYPVEGRYKIREYQLKLIMVLMKHELIELPIGYENSNLKTALDLFISYILLDCLISNADRHHENWGWIAGEKRIYLSPTYDHASGLGCRENEEIKKERLNSKDERYQVKSFVQKAKTPFYNKTKKLKTIEAFNICIEGNEKIAIYWLNKLETLNLDDIRKVFNKIPKHLISITSIEFAMEMLAENKKRLLKIKKELTKDD